MHVFNFCVLFLTFLLVHGQQQQQQQQGDSNHKNSPSNANNNEDTARVFKHPLTDMPDSSEDITTSFYFPSHGDLKLPIGEVVTALCHLINKGHQYYNISAIMGSLNSPFDFRHHFQNYSYKPIGVVVKSDEEITMQYSFQLHPDLEPVDYQLALTVFYESENEAFSTTFFNQTVELYSVQSDYDFETISSVIYSFLLTIFVALVALYACFPETQTSQQINSILKRNFPVLFAGSGISAGFSKSDAEDDWTVVQHKSNRKVRRSTRGDEEDDEVEEDKDN